MNRFGSVACSLLLLLSQAAPRAWGQSPAPDPGRAQREQELRDAIATEIHGEDARSEAQSYDRYARAVIERIAMNWRRPASARPGLECVVNVTQGPTGLVIDVRVAPCNGDEETVRSIVRAVYVSSPLPIPEDPAQFRRDLVVTFRPEE
jgi:colicin import membrane protein